MHLWDLQKAIKTKLSSYAPLTDLLYAGGNSVLDDVRIDENFPYIAIYEVNTNAMDTKDQNGTETLVSIHVYSRHRGAKQIKQIIAAIYDALHRQELSPDNGVHVDTNFSGSNNFVEEDGLTRHGIVNFKILMWS